MSLRPAVSLVAAAMLAVILLTAAFQPALQRPLVDIAVESAASVPSASASPWHPPSRANAGPSDLPTLASTRETPPAPRPALTLALDAQLLLTEEIALRQLAGETAPALTDEQWRAFAEVTAECQDIRLAYEATRARVTRLPSGVFRAEIPLYPGAGDALRWRLESGLRSRLGDIVAAQVLEVLGRKLEGYFGGFGVSVQTVEVSASSADTVQITRRVQRGVSDTDGGTALVSHLETFLPGIEDPAGLRWGPLLALAAEVGAAPAP